jgi:glycosyltransferase involved in cell wall biosynthesis
MLVSLVTVCFNSEQTIRCTIESVLNQTYSEIEYIIVDGLSKDNTLEIVHEYDEKFTEKGYKYRVISEKDNGIYDAMNKGIQLAAGELVGIINSDDWYEPIAVETAVNTYKEAPYDMFYADINLVKANGAVMVKHSKHDRFPTSRHWNHPTTFVTKKTYDELGAFRCEGIHDDFDFILRVRRAGKRIVIKNVVLANFRTGGASNDKTLKKCVKRCKDRYRCYRNNKYSPLYFVECFAIEVAKFLLS